MAGYVRPLIILVRNSLATESLLLTIRLRCDMIALPLLRDGKTTGDKNAKKKSFCKLRL